MNSFSMVGRICRGKGENPWAESGKTPKGTDYCRFRIAVYDTFKRDNNFFTLQAWGKLSGIVMDFCNPGDQIGVQGRIENNTYKDKRGSTHFEQRFIVEKLTLPKKADVEPDTDPSRMEHPDPDRGDTTRHHTTQQGAPPPQFDDDDDLPF